MPYINSKQVLSASMQRRRLLSQVQILGCLQWRPNPDLSRNRRDLSSSLKLCLGSAQPSFTVVGAWLRRELCIGGCWLWWGPSRCVRLCVNTGRGRRRRTLYPCMNRLTAARGCNVLAKYLLHFLLIVDEWRGRDLSNSEFCQVLKSAGQNTLQDRDSPVLYSWARCPLTLSPFLLCIF